MLVVPLEVGIESAPPAVAATRVRRLTAPPVDPARLRSVGISLLAVAIDDGLVGLTPGHVRTSLARETRRPQEKPLFPPSCAPYASLLGPRFLPFRGAISAGRVLLGSVLSGGGSSKRGGVAVIDGPAWSDVVRVAARATVDPKTVRRYLDGAPTRSTTQRRIERGLKSCGLEVFVRKVAG